MAAADDGQQGGVDRGQVAVEERGASRRLPAGTEAVALAAAVGGGGVGERAEHAGHVAQRRVVPAALGHRSGRLALEVEDHPAVGAEHDLAEVEVAVVADDDAEVVGEAIGQAPDEGVHRHRIGPVVEHPGDGGAGRPPPRPRR